MHGPINLRMAVMDVHLHNLSAGPLACVAHFQADLYWLISGNLLWVDFQIAVLERRIAQSKAKWELGFDAPGVVVAIADVNSLGVIYLEVFARIVRGRR